MIRTHGNARIRENERINIYWYRIYICFDIKSKPLLWRFCYYKHIYCWWLKFLHSHEVFCNNHNIHSFTTGLWNTSSSAMKNLVMSEIWQTNYLLICYNWWFERWLVIYCTMKKRFPLIISPLIVIHVHKACNLNA